MRVGLIGTSAIAHKHAQAYRNIGYELVACANRNEERGRAFAAQWGARYASSWQEVCEDATVDFVDLCTLPGFRLEPLQRCCETGKSLLVQKPIATTVEIARKMVNAAEQAGITLGVVSQHRFDESSRFLIDALRDQRLGRILHCDCYVKWYRSPDYYARPVKGTWKAEGGGVLINQALHQVDLLRYFAGPIREVYGSWQQGAVHAIESEDVVSALVRYESGASGVIQASTAMWPGMAERIEIHGTEGSAVVTGDRLTYWQVRNDRGPKPPLTAEVQTGASDPLALSLDSFERQFRNFGEAVRNRTSPLPSASDAFDALSIVQSVYQSCRSGRPERVETL